MTTVPPSEIASATTFASAVTVQGAFTSQGIDDNATSTAMTLDASGNLLVGKTALSGSTAGTEIFSVGLGRFVRSGGDVLNLNRLSSDGTIVDFQKDGSTVGRIGTFGGRVYLADDSQGGISFSSGSKTLFSTNNVGSVEDNAMDIGSSSYRFKDLYLSGSIHGDVKFENNAGTTEYARFDSSGNLLVGKTATDDFTVVGTQIDADGFIAVTRDGSIAALFNRETSDGDILQFRKDNTTVGSIGTGSGRIHIGQGDTGLSASDTFNSLIPWNTSTNAQRDAGISLGGASARFTDLYLSGGVYLGGTGSANKLDDYESGTYEATLSPSTSGSITLSSSYNLLSYTKVGRLVTVTGRVRVSSVSSPVGFSADLSLPFATHSDSEESSRTTGCVVVAYAAQPINAYGIHPTTSNVSYVNITRIDASTFPTNSAQDFSGDEHIGIMVTYMTA